MNTPTLLNPRGRQSALTAANRKELLWLVVDRGARGLCVFEAIDILERRYPTNDIHHGKVSGNMNWLMTKGYVEGSGHTRTTPSNNPSIAWVPTPRAKERIRLAHEQR